MRSLSNYYKQKIASGETRIFHVRIEMTLADGTVFDDGAGNEPAITDTDIMDGTFKLESASSGTSTFDIGAAVIGMCKFSLDNYDERWSQYDFFGAVASVWVKLDGDSAYERMGIYTVDEPQYAGAIVSLELLDNMYLFDVPMPSLSFPCTCMYALNTVCTHCGVVLSPDLFHGYDFQLTVAPEQEMNCREFLQYVAMITCNFCVIDSQGRLVLRWYDTSAIPAANLDGGTFNTNTTPYSDGDDADGGNFTDYTSGDSYDGGSFTGNENAVWFTRNFSAAVGTDEITVTGIKITVNEVEYYRGISQVTVMPTPSYQIENEVVEYVGESTGSYIYGVFYKCVESSGSYIWEVVNLQEYILVIENPLIGEANVSTAMSYIWNRLQGFKFRTFNVSSLPDITGELGDACAIKDLKGNTIYSYISLISFAPTSMNVQFNAETPSRQLGYRMSKSVQTALEQAKKQTAGQISNYDVAVNLMNNLAVNAMGAYQDYEDLPTGGRVYYLSNKPITKSGGTCSFDVTATVYKMSGDGFFVSFPPTPPSTTRTWTNGYSGGELVVNVLKTIGLSAEWILTGLLTIGGVNYSDTAHLEVQNPQGVKVVTLDKDGLKVFDAQGNVHVHGSTTGLNVTKLNATDDCTFGNLNIGKKNVDTPLGEQLMSYIYGEGWIEYWYENWEGVLSKGISKTVYFSPYYDGWSDNLDVNVEFYATDTDWKEAHDSMSLCTVILYRWTGTTWSTVQSLHINADGNEINDKDTYFTGFTKNDKTVYRLRMNLTRKSWAEDYNIDVYCDFSHVFELNPYEITGSFRGHLEGSASLYSLAVNDVTISPSGSLIFDDEETRRSYSIKSGGYESSDGYGSDSSSDGSIKIQSYDHPSIYIKKANDSKNYIRIHTDDPYIKVSDSDNENIVITTDLFQTYGSSSRYTIIDNTSPSLTINTSSNKYISISNSEMRLQLDSSNYCRVSRLVLDANYNGVTYYINWTQGSDERIKDDIESLDTELSRKLIDATETKKFRYKNEEGKHYGMIAQEARKVLDSLGETDALLEYHPNIESDTVPNYMAIHYEEYIPHLINYVKDLRAELDRVKTELKELKEDK